MRTMNTAIKSKFHQGGIFLRISAMFLAVIIIQSATTLLNMNSVLQQKNYAEILRTQRYSIQKVAADIDAYLQKIDQLTLDIIYSNTIQNSLLNTVSSGDVADLLDSKGYQYGIHIAYIDNCGNSWISANVMVKPSNLVSRVCSTGLYLNRSVYYARLCFSVEKADTFDIYHSQSSDEYTLFAGRNTRHLSRNVDPGYLMIELNSELIALQMNDPLMRADTRYLLITADGVVILDSEETLATGDQLPTDGFLEHFSGEESVYYGETCMGEFLCVYRQLAQDDLALISMLPKNNVLSFRSTLDQYMIRNTLIISALSIALAFFFSFYFTRPIMALVQGMRRVRGGDFTVRVEPKHSDELGEMAVTFNQMVEDTNTLMENIREEHRLLREAEITALINQVNPHFLYNTLDNINMLARQNKDERIALLITELSKLLRITLSGGSNVITLRDELARVSCYLNILQMRSGKAFEYQIKMDSQTADCRIPKLILQPLVENAYKHGLKYVEDGMILISTYVNEENLVLRVADNGAGMLPEDMEALMEKLSDSDENTESGGVGLRNIYQRLSLQYGRDGFAFGLSSSELGGLNAMVTLIGFIKRTL